jgi:O-antigen ligase
VLNEDINPLIGAGHASFWLNADRVDRISQELGLYFKLNEAHNGYLEVYLNSGLIGLFLLILVLIVGAVKIKREAVAGSTYAAFRLALLIGTAAYGMTEAVFRLSIIFSALLLVLMEGSFEIESLDETEEVEHYSAVAT